MSSSIRRSAGVVAAALALGGCVVAPPSAYEPMPPRAHVRMPPPPPAPVAQAAMYFYPERGQDAERQERDRYECYRWAVGQSGFDPGMTRVTLPPPSRPLPSGRDGADVAAGAMTGAVIGSIASSPRHSGDGAIIGAIFGAALGAISQESRAQAVERANAAR
jgi:hypothetical protein